MLTNGEDGADGDAARDTDGETTCLELRYGFHLRPQPRDALRTVLDDGEATAPRGCRAPARGFGTRALSLADAYLALKAREVNRAGDWSRSSRS